MAQASRPAKSDEWEVRDAADTMKRAHKLRKDKRMMKHVRKHVKREASDMNALAQALQGGGAPQNMDQAFGP